MAKNPENSNDTEKEDALAELLTEFHELSSLSKFWFVWKRRIIFGIAFGVGFLVFKTCGVQILPYKPPEHAKKAHEFVHQKLLEGDVLPGCPRTGYERGPDGRVVHASVAAVQNNEEEVKVFVLPGSKWHTEPKLEEGRIVPVPTMQEPQQIPWRESFGKTVQKWNELTERTLGRTIRVNEGGRGAAIQHMHRVNLWPESPAACPGLSNHNHWEAADISRTDAYNKIPVLVVEGKVYEIMEMVEVLLGDDTDERKKVFEVLRQQNPGIIKRADGKTDLENKVALGYKVAQMLRHSVIGMHDLAMEAGRDVGLVGAFCGIKRDAVHYEKAEIIQKLMEYRIAQLESKSKEGSIRGALNTIVQKRLQLWEIKDLLWGLSNSQADKEKRKALVNRRKKLKEKIEKLMETLRGKVNERPIIVKGVIDSVVMGNVKIGCTRGSALYRQNKLAQYNKPTALGKDRELLKAIAVDVAELVAKKAAEWGIDLIQDIRDWFKDL